MAMCPRGRNGERWGEIDAGELWGKQERGGCVKVGDERRMETIMECRDSYDEYITALRLVKTTRYKFIEKNLTQLFWFLYA